MDRSGRLTPGSHGQDDCCGTGDHISPGPNSLPGGLAAFLVGNDVAPLTHICMALLHIDNPALARSHTIHSLETSFQKS